MQCEIVPIDPLHIREICETMREREALGFAQLGWNPEQKITHEVLTSFMSWAGVVNGRTFALGGVKCDGIFSEKAYAWLLCSECVSEVPLSFVRGVLQAFALVKPRFKTIYGLVDVRFEKSVRWLEWMGFTVEPPSGTARLFWWGVKPDGA
jgi:hypothetical protein